MTDVDRLHRHLEERAQRATVEATPMASIVRRATQRDRRRRAAIGSLSVAAVSGLVVGALWMGGSRDSQMRSVDSVPGTDAATGTTVPETEGGATAFTAAIEASGVLTSPSADEVAQASDLDLYRDDQAAIQVSPAGNYVSLRRCRDVASATCGTGWAYRTGVAGGSEGHSGLLGEASGVNVHLYSLDDRYFVAVESAPGTQAPSRTWLIDSVSGQSGVLAWSDEPTTLHSPEQSLLLCEESFNSGGTECAVTEVWDGTPRIEEVGEVSAGGTTVTQTSLVDGRYTYVPTEVGLPKVVDARDGTIRPLAMPDNVVAGLPVAQHGTGRIWIGTDPAGERLGLAYSDDGGATWHQVAFPDALSATDEELADNVFDDLLEIAADGDRVAVADSWGVDDGNTVFVSHDAGRSWTTVSSEPSGNGMHLYVLADGRLAVMGSMDSHPGQLLTSTGPYWAELENVDVDFDPGPTWELERRFSINRAGVALIRSYVLPCDDTYPCPGYSDDESGVYVLDTIDFSTDLTNWSSIEIPRP